MVKDSTEVEENVEGHGALAWVDAKGKITKTSESIHYFIYNNADQLPFVISVAIGTRPAAPCSQTTAEDIKQLAQTLGSTTPTGLVNRRY